MGCVIEFDKNFRFNFVQNKCKQKIWIEVLLHYTAMDLNHMALLLEQPEETLAKVYQGDLFFSQEPAERLGKLLLLALSD